MHQRITKKLPIADSRAIFNLPCSPPQISQENHLDLVIPLSRHSRMKGRSRPHMKDGCEHLHRLTESCGYALPSPLLSSFPLAFLYFHSPYFPNQATVYLPNTHPAISCKPFPIPDNSHDASSQHVHPHSGLPAPASNSLCSLHAYDTHSELNVQH